MLPLNYCCLCAHSPDLFVPEHLTKFKLADLPWLLYSFSANQQHSCPRCIFMLVTALQQQGNANIPIMGCNLLDVYIQAVHGAPTSPRME